MKRLSASTLLLLLSALLQPLLVSRGHAQANPLAEFDEDYTLQASMLGYRGVGGEIEGVRNPTLRAERGERVRITIVGVENLPHDIALEKLGIKSKEVTAAGEKSVITFTAQDNDTYYCTMPGHRAAGMVGQLEIVQERPTLTSGTDVVKNGRKLNLGFETGTLQDWVVNGEAFAQGVHQDRTANPATRHEGSFWVTSGDTIGYRASGTLTSAPFTVTQPWASFKVAGGALADTRVEIVRVDGDSVIFEISGYGGRALRPVVVDLRRHQGKQIYVRLVDRESGLSGLPYIRDNKLAFIAFDAFKQYATRPTFPNELAASEVMILPPLSVIKNAGLSGTAAAAAMDVPEGFTVKLAAAEPEVVRPIAFTMDDRGRLWVVEAHTYPVRAAEGQGQDRVLVLEDTNGDGTLDSRKVAIEGLNLVSGIEVGFGGVWLGAAPYLLFIPMDAATDRPTGPAQIMLDGWGYQDTHETLNSLTWGPDGWLYGTQGIFTKSSIAAPGTPEAQRTKMNAGIWRFHPRKHVFEVFADGTSNPWGVDFDEMGQAFVTACVIPHLFHMIQGGHYQLQAGKHLEDYVYDDIQTVADHRHWVGTYGPHAGNNRSDEVGGGHAHAGAMFYMGGSWPAEYRGRLFMNNVHGAKMNTDILERQGSGYVGHHGKDFLVSNDSWSQMIDMQYGPDGSVWIIDWYDKNQCHSANPDVHQKTLGRIFKLSYRTDRPVQVDLQKLSSLELVQMQLNQNEWYVRHARRILQERGPDPAVDAALKRILAENPDVSRRLRALWALHATGGLSDAELTALLSDRDEYVRSWSVQLLAEDGSVPQAALDRMAAMSRDDQSPVVRMYLASGMQRVPAGQRWDVLAGLSAHGEDAADHNLPLMLWYAAAPMAGASMDRALGMALSSRIPTLLPYTVQRMASLDKQAAVRTLSTELGRVTDARQQAEIMKGLNLLVTPTAP
jgi:putative membrane-bound dehydrogenase-like protein